MIEIIKDKIQELLGSEYDVYLNNTVEVLQQSQQHKNLCLLVAQSGDIEPLKGVSGLNANCTLVMSYQASASGYDAEEDKIRWATTLAEQALQTLAAEANGYIDSDGDTWNYIFNFSVPKPMSSTTLNGEIWYNVVLPINVIITTDLMFGNAGVVKIGNPFFILQEDQNAIGQTITFSVDGMAATDIIRIVMKGYVGTVIEFANPLTGHSFAQTRYSAGYTVNGTTASFWFSVENPPEEYTETATIEVDNQKIARIGYDFSAVPIINGITKWDYIFSNNLEYVAKVSTAADNRAKAVQVFSNLQMPLELLLMATSEHYLLLTGLRNNPTTRLWAEFTLPIAEDLEGNPQVFREVFVVLPKDVHISGSLGQFVGMDITLSEALNE